MASLVTSEIVAPRRAASCRSRASKSSGSFTVVRFIICQHTTSQAADAKIPDRDRRGLIKDGRVVAFQLKEPFDTINASKGSSKDPQVEVEGIEPSSFSLALGASPGASGGLVSGLQRAAGTLW